MLASQFSNKTAQRRWWLGVSAGIAVSLYGLLAWGKYDFCSGWAKHYEDSASQLQIEASDSDLPATDVHESLIVAEWDEVIARKYWRAAFQPWPFGSYPKAPLVSKQEQVAVLEQLAKDGRLPQQVADELLTALSTSQ